jgi:hypothetical protein
MSDPGRKADTQLLTQSEHSTRLRGDHAQTTS